MPSINLEDLKKYRAQSYFTLPGTRLHTMDEAVEFVNLRGFIFFWPVKNVELPSLWAAVAGDRPVPDEHDDPGHITWDWKDRMLGKKRWYYARILRRRNTFISMSALPYFYALSPNYGEPETDYLDQYEEGLMTAEARAVFEALLREGPLDTLALRRAAHMKGPSNDTRFNRALDNLQLEFKALPVGISDAGSWHYAFIYDLTHRHIPELISQARGIAELEACVKLVELYLRSVGAAQVQDIARLFGWEMQKVSKALEILQRNGVVQTDLEFAQLGGNWLALSEILQGV
ncbi:MAG: crosslink repair DNA glycosylase YcaQ family protein [Anaerolineaceae bacterium]|jgi:hypothetical protein